MTVIQTGSTPLTLINVFTVAPERQGVLIAHLQDATEQIMRHQRGFVSANIHASLDGTRVVNYAQWQTRQDFEAMLANPPAQAHMVAALEIATSAEPKLYEVTHTYQR
ncbi:MAG: antibiotic biosynthesis monooxygenase [Actinomycetota bacterium]|nr:antibiotic biosynthesis monooxygenase [Actinomycetota bacterium]